MGVPASLGFLRSHVSDGPAAAAVAAELVQCARVAEPSRWADKSDEELTQALDAEPASSHIERHCDLMVGLQRAMYLDAARDVRVSAPGQPRVSIFRVQEHMAKLEQRMEEHLQWYGEQALPPPPAAQAKAGGFGGSKPAKAAGGFGGGKTKAKKGAKGKKK